ncbi:MAG: ABC transporter permease [Flavobacteriales bacterium]|nr:ABC transporter permease [Flavobacteriales bacterium]
MRKKWWRDGVVAGVGAWLIIEILWVTITPFFRPGSRGQANTQYRQARLLAPFSSGKVCQREGLLYFYRDNSPQSCSISEKIIFILGTDAAGRDVMDRLTAGLKISLLVGFLGMAVSVVLGCILGALAGFFGGLVDACIVALIQVLWAFPSVFLALTFSILLGKGLDTIVVAIGLSLWTETARMVRGEVLRCKTRLFVLAAQALGYGPWRQLIHHVLPNVWPVVLITSVGHFSTAVLLESGLSFLGLGIEPPTPSLGNLISENKIFLFAGYSRLVGIPSLLLVVNTLAMIVLANRLRDLWDVRRQEPPLQT